MKQKPSFQLYQQDFLGSLDVQTMTAEQVGCYILMLVNCYNNGGTIPRDDEDLKLLCHGIAPSQKVMKKFYIFEDFLKNKRCDEELKKHSKFSKSQATNANKRWNKPLKEDAKSMPSQCHGIDSASIRQCSSTSTSTSTSNTISKEIAEKSVEVEKRKKEYGNPDINRLLSELKAKIGVTDFVESQKIQRQFASHLIRIKAELGEKEFPARVDTILKDGFKMKNCNSLQYLYKQIKGFISLTPESCTATQTVPAITPERLSALLSID